MPGVLGVCGDRELGLLREPFLSKTGLFFRFPVVAMNWSKLVPCVESDPITGEALYEEGVSAVAPL